MSPRPPTPVPTDTELVVCVRVSLLPFSYTRNPVLQRSYKIDLGVEEVGISPVVVTFLSSSTTFQITDFPLFSSFLPSIILLILNSDVKVMW